MGIKFIVPFSGYVETESDSVVGPKDNTLDIPETMLTEEIIPVENNTENDVQEPTEELNDIQAPTEELVD